MYKRKARILFIGMHSVFLRLTCQLLDTHGGDWLEGRWHELLADGSLPSEHMDWADLLVTLDEASYRWLQRGRCWLPVRRWTLPQDSGEIHAYLQRQLSSMAAGMRMLARQGG